MVWESLQEVDDKVDENSSSSSLSVMAENHVLRKKVLGLITFSRSKLVHINTNLMLQTVTGLE